MKAIVCSGAKNLDIRDIQLPPLENNQVKVNVAYGGICGSDMHYYHRGAVGDFKVKEPLILGHEISGVVAETGAGVTHVEKGMKVALNPSKPCRICNYCKEGKANLCDNMYFLGSAGRFPHVQGGFSEQIILRDDQIIPVPQSTPLDKLSCAEPLSVGLHAVNQCGPLMGKKVIITGSGPIGLLTAASALYAGATEVVATDVAELPLKVALEKIGVTKTINIAAEPDALAQYTLNGGYFDVAFEASGIESALQSLFGIVKKGGKVVQLGMHKPGLIAIPVNVLQSKEIELIGAFRANNEFALAVDLIVNNKIDVSPIMSGCFELEQAVTAFESAGDRSRNIKLHVQLSSSD